MSQFAEGQCVSRWRLGLAGVLVTSVLASGVLAHGMSQSAATTTPGTASQSTATPTRAVPEANAQQSAAPTQPPSGGPAAADALQVPPDTVVMKVGNQQITAAQFQLILKTLNPGVQRSLATQGYKPLGENYATFLALAQKAAADGLDQTGEFKQKMELARNQALVQDEYKKLNESVQVKQDEVDKYYAEHHDDFEQVQIRQVSVRKKPANAKGDAAGLPDDEAKKRAEDIRQALASGQDASTVADQYKLANVVFFDPAPRSVRHGQLPAETDRQAWTLKDGGLSEIQNNPMNYYFIQVVKRETPPVAEVSKEIEGKLREEKFKGTLDGVKNQANIWLDPKFFAAPPAMSGPAVPKPAAPTTGTEPAPGSNQKPN